MLEVFTKMQKLGVKDANWRRVLSDSAFADRVAAVMLDAKSASVAAAFDDLVKAGKFTYVNPGFQPENDARWYDTKGDRVRGRFELVRMGRNYREPDANAEAAKVSGRRVANAHEVAAFAALGVQNGKKPSDPSDHNGWNGTDWVVAFGSLCAFPVGGRSVAYLWCSDGWRGLDLDWADSLRGGHNFVLCVCE